ncbi:hypothetical protein E2C01_060987 [Portunus trituberculatus]|uniref:Uncharacterized protein n=1 Tax=Portunus trituberculatus TaxID=210409 RepID=A0A5B7H6Y0_PORTR|nr:hypothetical protein [Portunus trituberculatus]
MTSPLKATFTPQDTHSYKPKPYKAEAIS